jgi:uncharacterized RDD family membrane protein YckC
MSIEAGSLGEAQGAAVGRLVEEGRGGWSDLAPHPVRRWIARAFDGYITTGLVLAVLAAPSALVASSDGRYAVIGAAAILFLLPPMRGLFSALLYAFLLSRTATTPGKWLCGVRIVRRDGAPLSFRAALGREMRAYVSGCGLYLPLIVLCAMGYNFFRLRDVGATSWDQACDLVVEHRPNSAGQTALTLVAVVLVALVLLILALIGFGMEAARRAG